MDEEQIEDARKGIEGDLAARIGRFVPVGFVQGEDVQFVARRLGEEHSELFDQLCRAHLNRVTR